MQSHKLLTQCVSLATLFGVFIILFGVSSTAPTTFCTLSNNPPTATPSVTGKAIDVLDVIVTDQMRAAAPANFTTAENKVTESEENTEGPTKKCLQCLCKVVSGCKPVKCANQPPCGIYAISKWYWADVGKLKTTEKSTEYSDQDEEFRDYLRCVNNEKCATDTVRNYLQIYSRDCNDDGIIDCEDYIALHLNGPTGCKTNPIKALRRKRMQQCLLE